MSAFSPASEVMLRHTDQFLSSRVLFAGDLQDDFPLHFSATDVKAQCAQFHHWRRLQQGLGDRAEFSLYPSGAFADGCDTLIYYWPKSKQEAQFQLEALLSVLPVGCDVFIVGENRSGVRSAENLFSPFGAMNKIDSARRCGLYYGRVETRPQFDPQAWWQSYTLDDLTVKTLPGVFSRDDLDVGSELLLTVLAQRDISGTVLDIGCGTGVLSAVLKTFNPDIELTLADVSCAALASSRATLDANGMTGEVIASDVFSEIKGRYNFIISNPPFHDGLQTDLSAAEALIRGAKDHLQLGGRLCIVANAFLPYAEVLDRTFGNHEVLAQTGRFKVYASVLQRPSAPRSDKVKSTKRR